MTKVATKRVPKFAVRKTVKRLATKKPKTNKKVTIKKLTKKQPKKQLKKKIVAKTKKQLITRGKKLVRKVLSQSINMSGLSSYLSSPDESVFAAIASRLTPMIVSEVLSRLDHAEMDHADTVDPKEHMQAVQDYINPTQVDDAHSESVA